MNWGRQGVRMGCAALRCLPGYSEDLKAYTSQGKREEILNKLRRRIR